MKINKSIVGVAAIAAVAFTVGRLGLPLGNQSTAIAQDQGEMKMTPEQEARMKAATPGKNHEYLEALIGDFTADVKIWESPDAEPMQFTGTVSRKWILDGHFVQETIEAEGPFGSFEALGFIGYNNIDGEYQFAWLENQATMITVNPGFYNADEKKLIQIGKHRNPATGKLITSWSVLDLSDPYRHTVNGEQVGPDGKEFKNFEAVFERKQ